MPINHVESGLSRAADQDRGTWLRRSLQLDAVASGALGVLLVAAGPALDELLRIPMAVLVPVGVFLVAYAAVLWMLGVRRRMPLPAIWAVVVGNLLWVAASLVVVVAGWWTPTAAGTALVLVQAAAGALFAGLQFLGLRAGRAAL
jgi:hypothetical protein